MRGGHPNFGCWKSKNTQFTPHARGQPTFFMKKLAEAQFSPHVRGSTHETDTVNSDGMIHPACAGVTLSREWLYEPVYSPRMRGGQPFLSIGLSMVLVFTPHARGLVLEYK